MFEVLIKAFYVLFPFILILLVLGAKVGLFWAIAQSKQQTSEEKQKEWERQEAEKFARSCKPAGYKVPPMVSTKKHPHDREFG